MKIEHSEQIINFLDCLNNQLYGTILVNGASQYAVMTSTCCLCAQTLCDETSKKKLLGQVVKL